MHFENDSFTNTNSDVIESEFPTQKHENCGIFFRINIIDSDTEFENKFKFFSHSLLFFMIYGCFR